MENEKNKDLIDEVKKYFDEKTEETKRHFDIALEHIDERFDAIVESQKITDAKVDSLVEDMDYVKSEIVEIKDRFKETDKSLAKKAEKEAVSDHETRLLKLENTALAKA